MFDFAKAIAAVQTASTKVEWLPPAAPIACHPDFVPLETSGTQGVGDEDEPTMPAESAVDKLALNEMNGLGNGLKLS